MPIWIDENGVKRDKRGRRVGEGYAEGRQRVRVLVRMREEDWAAVLALVAETPERYRLMGMQEAAAAAMKWALHEMARRGEDHP